MVIEMNFSLDLAITETFLPGKYLKLKAIKDIS